MWKRKAEETVETATPQQREPEQGTPPTNETEPMAATTGDEEPEVATATASAEPQSVPESFVKLPDSEEHNVRVPLSIMAKVETADELAAVLGRIDELEAELAVIKKDFKGRIDERMDRASALASRIREGDLATVACEVWIDHAARVKRLVSLETGEILATCPLAPAELQREIFEQPASDGDPGLAADLWSVPDFTDWKADDVEAWYLNRLVDCGSMEELVELLKRHEPIIDGFSEDLKAAIRDLAGARIGELEAGLAYLAGDGSRAVAPDADGILSAEDSGPAPPDYDNRDQAEAARDRMLGATAKEAADATDAE